MSAIKFVALPVDAARALQAGGADFNGQQPERRVSDGQGVPCRLTLRPVPAGEPYLILSYRPFPAPQPYAEVGTIFLHEESQARWPESDAIPPALESPRYRVLELGRAPCRERVCRYVKISVCAVASKKQTKNK